MATFTEENYLKAIYKLAERTGKPDVSTNALAEVLPQNGILTPWDDLGAPVVVVVWERRLALTGADDPRLELFIAELGGGETAPEPLASCAGGIEPPEDPGTTQV